MLKSRLILYSAILVGALILLKINLSQKAEKTPETNTVALVGKTDSTTAAESTVPVNDGKKIALLSSHMTLSTFDGLKDHTCRGLTALCPDKCGESGKLASFAITKYLKYSKPGEYGDPEQKNFQIMYENTLGESKLNPENKELIASMKPGDVVLLCWNHNYITDENGSSYPERTITVLKKLTEEEVKKEIQNNQNEKAS